MELTPLKHAHHGSNTTHSAYDATTRKLRVKFASGKVAEYSEVPAELAEKFIHASSHGHFFNHHIKTAGFDWRYV